MAELHSNFYFKHPDGETHKLLVEIFTFADLNAGKKREPNIVREKIISNAALINAKNGATLAADFYDHIIEVYFDDFGSENIWEDSGYSVSHWVGGSGGDEMQNDLMHFIYNLCPDIHAQSWGCGDDDPWEYWFKYENGQVLRWDDEPFEGEDDYLLGTVYRWWHSGIPNKIKEGFLNDEDYVEDYDIDKSKWNIITDDTYEEWHQKLLDENSGEESEEYLTFLKELESDEDDNETDEDDVLEIGPELSDQQLAELHSICREILDKQQASIKDYLKTFSLISTCLLKLEEKHHSGQEIHEENAQIFSEILEQEETTITEQPLNGYLCSYYHNEIERISKEKLLGTLILLHDGAYELTDLMLGSQEEDDDENEILSLLKSSTTYDEFIDCARSLIELCEVFDE